MSIAQRNAQLGQNPQSPNLLYGNGQPFPRQITADWTNQIQGVTTDGANWYITQGYCCFDDAANLETPIIGPFAPILDTNKATLSGARNQMGTLWRVPIHAFNDLADCEKQEPFGSGFGIGSGSTEDLLGCYQFQQNSTIGRLTAADVATLDPANFPLCWHWGAPALDLYRGRVYVSAAKCAKTPPAFRGNAVYQESMPGAYMLEVDTGDLSVLSMTPIAQLRKFGGGIGDDSDPAMRADFDPPSMAIHPMTGYFFFPDQDAESGWTRSLAIYRPIFSCDQVVTVKNPLSDAPRPIGFVNMPETITCTNLRSL